jgi:hypothetical protein
MRDIHMQMVHLDYSAKLNIYILLLRFNYLLMISVQQRHEKTEIFKSSGSEIGFKHNYLLNILGCEVTCALHLRERFLSNVLRIYINKHK